MGLDTLFGVAVVQPQLAAYVLGVAPRPRRGIWERLKVRALVGLDGFRRLVTG